MLNKNLENFDVYVIEQMKELTQKASVVGEIARLL